MIDQQEEAIKNNPSRFLRVVPEDVANLILYYTVMALHDVGDPTKGKDFSVGYGIINVMKTVAQGHGNPGSELQTTAQNALRCIVRHKTEFAAFVRGVASAHDAIYDFRMKQAMEGVKESA